MKQKNVFSTRKILFLISLICLCGAVYFNFKPQETAPIIPQPSAEEPIVPKPPVEAPKPEPEPPQAEEPSPVPKAEPHGKLMVTPERQEYKDGDLKLVIPKLKLNEPIYGGTENADLKKGVCLFDYAQLPGEGDRNVSLAAHRNGRTAGIVNDHAPFYYVDQLADGDYLYLSDSANIYKYVYHSTEVVEDDDWSPIYSQGFSCLTLTSCEPIGINTHRIIVRAQLEEIIPLSKDYDYKLNATEK